MSHTLPYSCTWHLCERPMINLTRSAIRWGFNSIRAEILELRAPTIISYANQYSDSVGGSEAVQSTQKTEQERRSLGISPVVRFISVNMGIFGMKVYHEGSESHRGCIEGTTSESNEGRETNRDTMTFKRWYDNKRFVRKVLIQIH